MRKSKTFYNIFIPVLLLSVGIVIGFGSYIYISTTNSVVDRVGDGKQSLITQIRNTLEQKIQTIEYAFATYSTTPSFRSVINSPLTEQEFEAYQELKSQLGYIATMGLEGVQYTLVSLKQKWSLSNGSVSRLTSEETDAFQDQFAGQEGNGLYWTKTTDGIRLMQGLPVYSNKKQAVAVSDLSLHTLNQSLQSKPNTSIYILNKQGEPLYTTQTDQERLSNQQMKLISERTVNQAQTGKLEIPGASGDKIIALYARSDYNSWTYVTLLDQKEVSGALTTIRIGLIVMGIVIMALMVILAYIISIYLTKPFRKIQNSLTNISKPMIKDEVDWIIQSIDSIVSEKKDLEQLIQLEKPKLEAQFVLNLLQNRLTRDEVEKNLERFGYNVDSSTVFITMLIQVDRCGEGALSDKDVLLLTVNQLVQEIIPVSERMIPVVLNERTQATLLFCSSDKAAEIRNSIMKYAKNIILSSRDYWQASVSAGVSAPYEDLMNSREACAMSLEALYQRLKLGKESVIFYEDISQGSTGPTLLHYPTELESQLFDAIRLGDKDEASRALYPLLADMMKHSQNPMNLEITLIRFVNNLIQLEQLIGAEVLLTQSNATLYQRLLNTLNPEEIEHILVHDVIYPMVVSMQEKANHQFRSVADRIAAIVRTEYDQELSLESISERLHYTPNYLSSIFRKEYGMTFSDYLMGFRLEVARKWLVDTDMPIKDIAERLGYQNSQNFIRSFRKKEHVTPGAYRKMKLEL
ncbi:AraC family transcriptional regulator [Paenibacillus xylanilyticus]|uniref:AraC family transcriptional regulator n=1 Tax=Paenibacillus xylanilyticus TaxID=248903 RepID=A0A7Y6BXS5_9BACL|nr:AraC family transcriptional regulator [Paenibacillus xylanilyticus]NUU76905.1 AraC family transcriptional regulator [Paenibacillus xylanilyticus]